MATQEFVFSGQVLRPLFPRGARTAPIKLATGTYAMGQSIARQLSTGLGVAFVPSGSDGSGVWGMFLRTAVVVDAAGNHFLQSGSGAGVSSPFTVPQETVTGFTNGTFSPNDITTNTTTATEADTFTPASPTVGDVYTLAGAQHGVVSQVTYTVASGSATVAAVSAGLMAAWNALPATAAIATASGGTTNIVLTSTVANMLMNTSGSVTGTGTIAKAITTAAGGRSLADIQTGAPGARLLAESGAYEIP